MVILDIASSGVLHETNPLSQAILTSVKTLVEAQEYLFENLWKSAIPGDIVAGKTVSPLVAETPAPTETPTPADNGTGTTGTEATPTTETPAPTDESS